MSNDEYGAIAIFGEIEYYNKDIEIALLSMLTKIEFGGEIHLSGEKWGNIWTLVVNDRKLYKSVFACMPLVEVNFDNVDQDIYYSCETHE
jgi:hypothetical protein